MPRPGLAVRRALHGLSDRQRERVLGFLHRECGPLPGSARATVVLEDEFGSRSVPFYGFPRAGDTALEGWSVYRMPSTIHPPTTLRLLKRDENGRVFRVVSITEDGVTK